MSLYDYQLEAGKLGGLNALKTRIITNQKHAVTSQNQKRKELQRKQKRRTSNHKRKKQKKTGIKKEYKNQLETGFKMAINNYQQIC